MRPARALAPIANPGRRRGYLRVTLSEREGVLERAAHRRAGLGNLRSMSAADGLAIVPGDTTVGAGETVPVMLLREILTFSPCGGTASTRVSQAPAHIDTEGGQAAPR